jgi:23S rRNA pseudouridine2605 synthase
MFDEIKLKQLRAGVVMNGRKYGPYTIEVENRQNTNTWLNMKLYEGKNNEIRRVMRKFSLRVNRLQRIRYGPYTLGEVPEVGDLREVPVLPQIKHIMMQYYKDRARQASVMIEKVNNEKTVMEANKAFKKGVTDAEI